MSKLKSIFIASLFFTATSVYAEAVNPDKFCSEKELVISGFTKHFKNDGKYAQEFGYNERNWGVGIACSVENLSSWNESVEIGTGRNSYRKQSIYGAYNITYPVAPKVELGVKIIAANGYRILEESHSGWFVAPLFTTKVHLTDKWNINASVLPTIKSKNASGFVWLTLGYKFK